MLSAVGAENRQHTRVGSVLDSALLTAEILQKSLLLLCVELLALAAGGKSC